MNTGKLQRRWSAEQPPVYDKETHIVCLDIVKDTRTDEDGNEQEGYSYLPVEIDRQIDYGHIKSELIEAGFAQKDEFGLVMNAMSDVLTAASGAKTFDDFLKRIGTDDIKAFGEFAEFRTMCAEAAKKVMEQY